MSIIKVLEKKEAGRKAKKIYKIFEEQGKETPEWIKVMAHRPEILKEFFELFKTIMGKGKIAPFLKWKIAYLISQTLKCPFCVDATSKMLKKLGAKEEDLKKARQLRAETDKEKELFALVKEVTLTANVNNPELIEKLKKNFSEAEIVEIVSIIGLFNYINRFNNTLCILPE